MNLNIRTTVLGLVIMCSLMDLYGSRIKDLTNIEGTRDNQLVGYGLVVGLAGTGDGTLDYTKQALSNALKEFGINAKDVKSKNVAAVMLTADIGPFVKEGTRIDVTVSTIGDASTIQGGVLLQSPLQGADGVVYAVAQGPISVGGFLGGAGGAGGATVQQNHPTVGKISGGAIVEREINSDFINNNSINLLLHNPDFTSAVRLADVLNEKYPGKAQALNAGLVNLCVPNEYQGQEVNFIAAIGGLEVVPDVTARVVINERTGTIVATSNVRISTVALSHGSLTITISQNLTTSQPNPLNESGVTTVTPDTQTNVTEVAGGFSVVNDFPTIERLTTALNAIGVSTREMMSILQSIKSAGALQAELIIN